MYGKLVKFNIKFIWSSYEMGMNFMRYSYGYVPSIAYRFHQKFIKSSYKLHKSLYEFHMNITQILHKVHMKYKCTSNQIHVPNISYEYDHMKFIWTSHECSIISYQIKKSSIKNTDEHVPNIEYDFHSNFIRNRFELHMNYPNNSCEFLLHYK